jgi:threonine/homoserine/homoserine lactone efflux protein
MTAYGLNLTTLALFALVALATIATPGPTVLLAFSNGARLGVRRAVPGMLGAVASDFVLVASVAVGLGALLAASEFWFAVVKWVGAAYLAWIGLRMLRSQGELKLQLAAQGEVQAGARKVFMKSFLVAVTNPKGYLFCSALLPQFIDGGAPQVPQYLAIGTLFATLDFLIMFAYAAIGARAVGLLRRRAMLWMDRSCGAVLLALAGSLAFYRRSN